jgi:hypothetical protein
VVNRTLSPPVIPAQAGTHVGISVLFANVMPWRVAVQRSTAKDRVWMLTWVQASAGMTAVGGHN